MGRCGATYVDAGLEELTEQIKHELSYLGWPGKEWVEPRTAEGGAHMYDALIVGGGQCGLAIAHGLMREKVTNVICLDENEPGKEGPWVTYARMVTLRTPKHLTGLEYGNPNLTLQAYYEARLGKEAWAKLDKVPKEMWMQYLQWYREVLDIPVQNSTRVQLVEPLDPSNAEAGFRVTVAVSGSRQLMYARKVVLATGIQGGGEWHVPGFVKESVPHHLYAHTSEQIDFAALKGKRVAILGGGASAFDNAQFALGQGAGEVHLFVRREALPRVNPIRFMEFAGFLKHFADLDDTIKYVGIDFFMSFNQPPTNDTYNRAVAYPNFSLHLGSAWQSLTPTADGQQVRIVSAKGNEGLFDFLIVSTGMLTDARLRPELAACADQIATWADKFQAPAGMQRNQLIDDHPYLGPSFEFREKKPGSAPYLSGIYAYNYSATVSMGLSASALSGAKFSLPKLVSGITRSLFLEDSPRILSNYLSYREEEFVGVWPRDATSALKAALNASPTQLPPLPPNAKAAAAEAAPVFKTPSLTRMYVSTPPQ